MQHDVARRHTLLPPRSDAPPTAPVRGAALLDFDLVHDAADHEVTATASRRLRRPHDFLAAAHFMVGSGFHPDAGPTTLRLAAVLAARMHRSKDGHLPLSADATARQLRLSRRAVYRHTRVLRELGLLAYVEHGSKRNAMRTRHGDAWRREHGYRGTATIFAAVAPPVWDRAMGRTTTGEGYTARVTGVTDSGRRHATAAAIERRRQHPSPRQRTPVDNRRPCTPSVMPPQPPTTEPVRGEGKDSAPRERAMPSPTRLQRPKRPKRPTDWTAHQTAHAMSQARSVQLHTWWTQGFCLRQLAYALRPLLAAGWTAQEITRELSRWTVRQRPRHPAAYLTAEIRRRTRTGHLHLPDGLTTPRRRPPVSTGDEDDTPHGPRYAAMQAHKAATHRPAAARARTHLADVRRQLAARRGPDGPLPAPARSALADARPENVLLTHQEIAHLLKHTNPLTTGEPPQPGARRKEDGRFPGAPS
ncbi:helix-turn-helix domain-containing protein [Streptomyces sp. MNP-20]|uniref:helix-turn-helix domain-containing protein n=1 Tax=Streptomyces sp. MNP-20 TaxID=2721165 RepID=UPI0015535998|nr:helix-turn-helix domain-containing protein [Streptomyces sp. MNP-20]